MEERAKKAQAKADIMEQLSRSLQTERNTLKQTIKDLEEKLNGGVVASENVAETVISESATTEPAPTVELDNQVSNNEATTAAPAETSESQ